MNVSFEYNDASMMKDYRLIIDDIKFVLPLNTLRQILVVDNYLMVCMKHVSPSEWFMIGIMNIVKNMWQKLGLWHLECGASI